MIRMIRTEFMKLKRKRMIAGMFVFTGILALFSILSAFGTSRNTSVTDSFDYLYFPVFHNLSNIFLPFMLSVLGTSIFFDEYKNDTLKELLMVPMSRCQIFLAKTAALFLTSFSLMFLTAVLTVFGDLLADGFSDITWQLMVRVIWLYAQGSLLLPTAMLPIVFLIVATRKSYVFSICAALFYIAPVSLLPASLMGIHPLASVQRIVGASSPEALEIVSDGMKETVMAVNPAWCLISIAVIGVFFAAASVMTLRKQEV